ncbi:MAG: response regulator [Desulfobacterales bacterium]|nr:response regulator [Desulfobacterales bacterium]
MTAETNETILIVDDDPTNVKLLAAKLNDADYTILKAYGGQEALEVAQRQSPGLVLMDVMMPGLNGFDVTTQLKKSPQTSDIPVILVTALDGSDNKTKGLEAGADDFLNKPVNTAELKARVKSLLRMKRYSDQLKARAFTKEMTLSPLNDEETVAELRLPTLLIVEDSASDAKLIRSLLNNLPCNILTAQSGEEALSICRNRKVDVMILDLMLPGLDGYGVVKQIKEKAATQVIQIIVVTSLQDIDSKVKGFEFGVDDFLVKPIHFNEFLARVNSLLKKKAYHDKLMGSFEAAVQAAITDKLTGVYNSGYFQHCLKNELKRANRHHHPVSLLMMDIDDFKQVNDRHGHLAGDAVLQAIAAQIGGSIRDIDILARYGGDEFAIILPFTQQKNAAAVAERIRRAIAEFAFTVNEQTSLNISVSIGLAEYAIGAETAQEVIHRADRALYATKSDRKNNVCSGQQPAP